jgi:putative ABC transport system ATP-binding protein
MPYDILIKLDNVQKIYDEVNVSVRVFENLNIEIMEGEFITLIGPTGCGKTTLVNLITGLTRPNSGHIFVDGNDITKLSNDEMVEFRTQRMGIIFQTSRLIPDMTVFENVELPLAIRGDQKKRRKRSVVETLKIVGMSQFVHRMSSTLSVGEKRRVEIARALVTDSPILVMDEPLENLDSLSTEFVLMLLRGGHCIEGKTVIVTSHSKKMINAASRTIRLKKSLGLQDSEDSVSNLMALKCKI